MERLAAGLKRPANRFEPITRVDLDVDKLPESVREYMRLSELFGDNQPKMAFGPFRQMYDGAIALGNQTAVTGTTEVAMWPVAQYTGFAANQLRAGQVWSLTAFGIMTTAGASQGNITITPRFGTSSSGTALGASAATALAASGTNVPWRLEYQFIVRAVGNAGANSSVVGNGKFDAAVAAIAASTGNICFGSTASVSVDLSVASGLYMGVTMGSASDTLTTMGVILESLN
jgi:hypothetical protein